MFQNCNSFNNGGSPSISGWTTTRVTNMESMFNGAPAFNQPIGNWDVSSVTTMQSLFGGSISFNQNIGSWDVSSVTNMYAMFANTTVFNNGGSPSISGWTTSNVTNMIQMFNNAANFNQDLSDWCVILIPSAPFAFDTGATSWILPKPVWGAPC